jgi:hypothetical protein
MAIDGSGNAYVYAYNNKGGGDYLVLLKYASDGNLLWQKKNSNRSVSLNRSVLKIDALGNVHLALLGQDDAGKNDLLVVKYDPNGNVVSEGRYNGPGNGDDSTSRYSNDLLEVDNAGNVYMIGQSEGIGSGYDFVTLKFAPTGG